MRRRTVFFLICLVLLGLVGATIIIYTTRWGAALSDDSFSYIFPTRSFLSGNGLDVTTHFPPLLPMVLVVPGLAQIDPLVAIRWLNAFLFGFNAILCGWILYRLTDSAFFSLIGSAAFLVASNLIEVHSWAMSEPLYLTLMLLGFLTFISGSPGKSSKRALLSGLFFGLATLTRYIGISLVIAGALSWLLLADSPWRARLRNTAVFSFTAFAPTALWMLRNLFITGSPTSRSLAWHPMPSGQFWEAWRNFLLWLLPGRLINDYLSFWLIAFLSVGIVGSIWLAWRHPRSQAGWLQAAYRNPPLVLFLLSAVAYGVILWGSRSFLDANIPTDLRLLSPLLVIGILLLFTLLPGFWRRSKQVMRVGILLFCLVVLVVNLTRSVGMVQSYHQNGRGYASQRDHISEIYAYIRNRPAVPVYSNAWVALYFWTGRITQPIPNSAGVSIMKSEMQRSGAYLIIFDSIPVTLYGVTESELTSGLVEQIRLSEGTIYKYP